MSSISGEVRGHGSNDLSIYSRKTKPRHWESTCLYSMEPFHLQSFPAGRLIDYRDFMQNNLHMHFAFLGLVSVSQQLYGLVPLSCWLSGNFPFWLTDISGPKVLPLTECAALAFLVTDLGPAAGVPSLFAQQHEGRS